MTAACIHAHVSLVTGHAYTILGTVELKAGNTVIQQLVKMRNPWGREKYDGPWNDKDPKWTETLKKQANLVVADDGIFHMPIEDFKKAFTIYNIANYQAWHTSSANVKGKGKKFMKRFTSEEDQDIVVAVDYLNKRKLAYGCNMPNVFYNIYIIKGRKLLGKP